MDLLVQSQSKFERIQELRAAGDTEGWARLLMAGGLNEKERQTLRLTGEEARAYQRLKAERGLTDKQKAYRGLTNGQRRAQRKQQAAYEHLCELRRSGNTYRIVVLARKGREHARAVLTGVGPMPGVARFELTAQEAEAVKQREQPDPDRLWRSVEWRRIRAGAYRSSDWRWLIEREGSKRWVAYRDGERWGNWILGRRRLYGPRDEDYVPCETLQLMMCLIEAHRWDDDEDDEDTRARSAVANAAPEGDALAALQHLQHLRDAGDVAAVAKLYDDATRDSPSRSIPYRKLMSGKKPHFRLRPAEARALEQLWRERRLASSGEFNKMHPQAYIAWGDKAADVDEDIAPLVLALWQAGLDTWNSCQHHHFRRTVWIEFDKLHDARAFLTLVGRGHIMKDDGAVSGHDGRGWLGWQYEIDVGDCLRELQVPETMPLRIGYEDNGHKVSKLNPACFEFYRCSVFFPREDLAATLEQVRTNSQGSAIPEGKQAAPVLSPG